MAPKPPRPDLPPRKPVPIRVPDVVQQELSPPPRTSRSGQLTTPLLATSVLVVLVLTIAWARRWVWSGCAIETLLIVYGSSNGSRVLPFIPLWTLLATLNLIYAVSATSWLLYGAFTAACYPMVLLTCLLQFNLVADFVRKNLRKTLRQLHFTKDKIALFNLPALEIDTDVDGLMAIRGVTISLSGLTIVAHGIELGLKLADDIELAMHADQVVIGLFRGVEVGDVYANIKGGKAEMTFHDMGPEDDADAADIDSIFQGDTQLLRAATAGSEGFKDRPKLRESLTGVNWMKDSSAKAGLDEVRTLSPDDEVAEKEYREILDEIRTGSAVYQSRQQVLRRSKEALGLDVEDEKNMRAAVCADLHQVPSITHPPRRSVRVTTLQHLSPPWVRLFLHRLPFLLRLLLNVISLFHPVTIRSINAAGSGTWLTAMLQQNIFKHYAAHNAELRRLARRISIWLADANFCLELTDIAGLSRVPVSADYDIVATLKFADIMAYRTVEQSGTIAQVVRLGGADATFTVPSFLLPHHEHILPPKPTKSDEAKQEEEVEQADGIPKTVKAEHGLEQMQKDETSIQLSIHGSLPAVFDQSLLNFIAALVKATKIIELEKAADDVDHADEVTSPRATSPDATTADDASVSSMSSITPTTSRTDSGAGFRAFTRNIKQGLKDGSTRDAIKEFAKDVHQATRDGVKKAVVGGMVNDRWIAKMVGKIAAKLEQAQGDVGYSGEIPVKLEGYRERAEAATKLLP